MRITPIGNGVGDRLMVTAFVREFKRAWPEEPVTVDERRYPWIWNHNPRINWGTMRGSSRGLFADPISACFQRNSGNENPPWNMCRANGITPLDTTPEIFLTDRELGFGPLALSGLPRPVVALDWHAMDELRRWPVDRFRAVVELLRARGITTVEVGGHAPALGTDRALSVGLHYVQTAAILAACDLYVGNDSGTFHLAASVGTPQVVLFGPVKAAARAYRSTTGYDDMIKIMPDEIAEKACDSLKHTEARCA